PQEAQDRVLVARLEIADDEVADQLAVAPDLDRVLASPLERTRRCQASRRKQAQRWPSPGSRYVPGRYTAAGGPAQPGCYNRAPCASRSSFPPSTRRRPSAPFSTGCAP